MNITNIITFMIIAIMKMHWCNQLYEMLLLLLWFSGFQQIQFLIII